MADNTKLIEGTKQLIYRIFTSINPAIYLDMRCKDAPIVLGVITGLRKCRNFRFYTNKHIAKLNGHQYQDLVETTDLLLAFRVPANEEKQSYFPLDVKNSGGYIVAITDNEKDDKYFGNFDLYFVGDMPGMFPSVIQILEKGNEYAKGNKDQIPMY